MRQLFTDLRLAFAAQDFLRAAKLLKQIPASMRAFKRNKTRIRHGKYIGGSLHSNVAGTRVKNSKIAAQMNAMHDRWYAARFGSNAQTN